MGEYFGGYIFFPPIFDRTALIELVLHAIGVLPTDTQALEIWLPDGEDTNPTSLPPEQALSELAHVKEGAIFVHTDTLEDAAFWFESPIDGYQVINVWGYDMGLVRRKDRENRERVTSFIEHWLAICEQGQASFGFFGKYLQTIEKEYRDRVLPLLRGNNVEALLDESAIYWLMYLGPDLTAHWHSLHREITAQEVQTLPSQALFIRMSQYLYD